MLKPGFISATVRNPCRSRVTTPTATYKVEFGKRNGDGNGKIVQFGKIPKVIRLLALAHPIEGMIRAGDLKDWAEAARLIGVTRARTTQLGNLLLLAPEIQEEILNFLQIAPCKDTITERNIRSVVANAGWAQQRKFWKRIIKVKGFHE